MFLNRERMQRCQSLSTQELRQALERSGYGSEDVSHAEFVGMNTSGAWIYSFQYPNEAGEWESGRVYVRPEEDPDTGAMVFTAEF